MDTLTAPTLADVGTLVEPLNAKDRCDRCGARAYVRVGVPAGATLGFCGHHMHMFEVQLMAQGFEMVEDIRAQLTPARETEAHA